MIKNIVKGFMKIVTNPKKIIAFLLRFSSLRNRSKYKHDDDKENILYGTKKISSGLIPKKYDKDIVCYYCGESPSFVKRHFIGGHKHCSECNTIICDKCFNCYFGEELHMPTDMIITSEKNLQEELRSKRTSITTIKFLEYYKNQYSSSDDITYSPICPMCALKIMPACDSMLDVPPIIRAAHVSQAMFELSLICFHTDYKNEAVKLWEHWKRFNNMAIVSEEFLYPEAEKILFERKVLNSKYDKGDDDYQTLLRDKVKDQIDNLFKVYDDIIEDEKHEKDMKERNKKAETEVEGRDNLKKRVDSEREQEQKQEEQLLKMGAEGVIERNGIIPHAEKYMDPQEVIDQKTIPHTIKVNDIILIDLKRINVSDEILYMGDIILNNHKIGKITQVPSDIMTNLETMDDLLLQSIAEKLNITDSANLPLDELRKAIMDKYINKAFLSGSIKKIINYDPNNLSLDINGIRIGNLNDIPKDTPEGTPIELTINFMDPPKIAKIISKEDYCDEAYRIFQNIKNIKKNNYLMIKIPEDYGLDQDITKQLYIKVLASDGHQVNLPPDFYEKDINFFNRKKLQDIFATWIKEYGYENIREKWDDIIKLLIILIKTEDITDTKMYIDLVKKQLEDNFELITTEITTEIKQKDDEDKKTYIDRLIKEKDLEVNINFFRRRHHTTFGWLRSNNKYKNMLEYLLNKPQKETPDNIVIQPLDINEVLFDQVSKTYQSKLDALPSEERTTFIEKFISKKVSDINDEINKLITSPILISADVVDHIYMKDLIDLINYEQETEGGGPKRNTEFLQKIMIDDLSEGGPPPVPEYPMTTTDYVEAQAQPSSLAAAVDGSDESPPVDLYPTPPVIRYIKLPIPDINTISLTLSKTMSKGDKIELSLNLCSSDKDIYATPNDDSSKTTGEIISYKIYELPSGKSESDSVYIETNIKDDLMVLYNKIFALITIGECEFYINSPEYASFYDDEVIKYDDEFIQFIKNKGFGDRRLRGEIKKEINNINIKEYDEELDRYEFENPSDKDLRETIPVPIPEGVREGDTFSVTAKDINIDLADKQKLIVIPKFPPKKGTQQYKDDILLLDNTKIDIGVYTYGLNGNVEKLTKDGISIDIKSKGGKNNKLNSFSARYLNISPLISNTIIKTYSDNENVVLNNDVVIELDAMNLFRRRCTSVIMRKKGAEPKFGIGKIINYDIHNAKEYTGDVSLTTLGIDESMKEEERLKRIVMEKYKNDMEIQIETMNNLFDAYNSRENGTTIDHGEHVSSDGPDGPVDSLMKGGLRTKVYMDVMFPFGIGNRPPTSRSAALQTEIEDSDSSLMVKKGRSIFLDNNPEKSDYSISSLYGLYGSDSISISQQRNIGKGKIDRDNNEDKRMYNRKLITYQNFSEEKREHLTKDKIIKEWTNLLIKMNETNKGKGQKLYPLPYVITISEGTITHISLPLPKDSFTRVKYEYNGTKNYNIRKYDYPIYSIMIPIYKLIDIALGKSKNFTQTDKEEINKIISQYHNKVYTSMKYTDLNNYMDNKGPTGGARNLINRVTSGFSNTIFGDIETYINKTGGYKNKSGKQTGKERTSGTKPLSAKMEIYGKNNIVEENYIKLESKFHKKFIKVRSYFSEKYNEIDDIVELYCPKLTDECFENLSKKLRKCGENYGKGGIQSILDGFAKCYADTNGKMTAEQIEDLVLTGEHKSQTLKFNVGFCPGRVDKIFSKHIEATKEDLDII